MTCIIGLVTDKDVYMGADSAAVGGYDIRTVKHPKVFRINNRVDNFLIGCTGSFRMKQLLQHRLNLSVQGGQTDFHYMVFSFAEAVRKLLKNYGFSEIDSNQEKGGTFLVGYHHSLYTVQRDFSVLEYTDDYHAVGCGADYALGALRVVPRNGPPRQRIEMALRVAAHFSNGVTGPFKILSLSGGDDG